MRSDDLSYFEEDEFLNCLAQYEESVSNGVQPYMDADELTDIAEYYMIKNRERDADKCISLATTLHPEAIDPQVFLARQQLFHGNVEEASRIARAIIDQQDTEVRFLWAEIAIKEGNCVQADQLLREHYDGQDTEKDIFLYDATGVFMDYEMWDYALAWAKRLKSEYPKFNNVDLLICEIRISCGELEGVTDELETLLADEPFNKQAWELLAEAQCSHENYHAALEAIDYLLALDENNNQGRIVKANCLFHLDRLDEAHQQYDEYLHDNPNDGGILFYDAMVLSALEKYDEAYQQLQRAVALLSPTTTEYYQANMQICYILSKLRKHHEAISTLTLLYNTTDRTIDSDYYFLKGHIHLENGYSDEASNCFDNAEELSTDPHGIRHMRAIELIENQYYAQGLSILHALLQTDMADKEANCYPYIAYATYFLEGQPHYKQYLQKAVLHNPKLTLYLFAPIYPNIPETRYPEL